jgi:hypothetical protein
MYVNFFIFDFRKTRSSWEILLPTAQRGMVSRTCYVIVNGKNVYTMSLKGAEANILIGNCKLVDVRVYSATLRFSKDLCRRFSSLGQLSFVEPVPIKRLFDAEV